MTPMICPICWEDFSIIRIASTALLTVSAPFCEAPWVVPTTSRARLLISAVLRTVLVSSPSADAVSSRLDACCSVRRERSFDAAEISDVPF